MAGSFCLLPTQPCHTAAKSALQHVVQTFFAGSIEETVTTLLAEADTQLSEEELTASRLIEQSRGRLITNGTLQHICYYLRLACLSSPRSSAWSSS